MATEKKQEGVRLKVNPQGGILNESVGGRFRQFKPGEVFIHDNPERAARLLHIGGMVSKTTELTTEEAAKAKATRDMKVGLGANALAKKAEEAIANIEKAVADLGVKLRKAKPEAIKAEAEKRGLEFPGEVPPPEDMVAAILKDEQAKLEADLLG